jgi:hypothetical protein
MRTTVDAVDHRIGCAAQLVVETARNKSSDHGSGFRLGCQHESRGRAFPAVPSKTAVDTLDDVVSLAELP